MKKRKLPGKLNLNKKAISHLNSKTLNGNGAWFTTGCTDGCSPAQTALNCTGTLCSNDCTNGASEEPVCPITADDFLN
jgi:hypothetical protein